MKERKDANEAQGSETVCAEGAGDASRSWRAAVGGRHRRRPFRRQLRPAGRAGAVRRRLLRVRVGARQPALMPETPDGTAPDYFGGPEDWRTTSLASIRRRVDGASGLARRSSSASAADSPSEPGPTSIVVNGGFVCAAAATPSKPVRAKSRPTTSPCSPNSLIAPKATTSL